MDFDEYHGLVAGLKKEFRALQTEIFEETTWRAILSKNTIMTHMV